MFCKNCGNEVADGVKFCNRCGFPMPEQAEAEPQAAPQTPVAEPAPQPEPQAAPQPQPQKPASNPVTDFAATLNSGVLAGGSKSTWLAVMAALAMLCIMAVSCSSLVINIMGKGISIPFMSASSMLGGISSAMGGSAPGEMTGATVGLVIYSIFAIINILLYAGSFIFVVKKQSVGVLAGMAAGALTFILSIIMIIVSFSLNGTLGAPSGTFAPSVWVWLAIPLGAVNALFCVVKGREIIS